MFRDKMKDGTVRLTGGQAKDPWPIGSIYMSLIDINPGEYFDGVWWRHGRGRMLIGVDPDNPDYNTVGITGGLEERQIFQHHLPPHHHSIPAHNHSYATSDGVGNLPNSPRGNATPLNDVNTNSDGGGNTGDGPGAGDPFSIMNPFVTVYMWKRMADDEFEEL